MEDNGAVSADYYNQMLSRPDQLRNNKHIQPIEMSKLDRRVIEKSSNNIKRLLKKIDMNSEHFLNWISKKEQEEKNIKGDSKGKTTLIIEEPKIKFQQRKSMRYDHDDSEIVDSSDEEK